MLEIGILTIRSMLEGFTFAVGCSALGVGTRTLEVELGPLIPRCFGEHKHHLTSYAANHAGGGPNIRGLPG